LCWPGVCVSGTLYSSRTCSFRPCCHSDTGFLNKFLCELAFAAVLGANVYTRGLRVVIYEVTQHLNCGAFGGHRVVCVSLISMQSLEDVGKRAAPGSFCACSAFLEAGELRGWLAVWPWPSRCVLPSHAGVFGERSLPSAGEGECHGMSAGLSDRFMPRNNILRGHRRRPAARTSGGA